VGKRSRTDSIGDPSEGHPHVCGEESRYFISSVLNKGTPPRVWGRENFSQLQRKRARDTPTCVGKSDISREQIRHRKGHPHVCGEELTSANKTQILLGTPPRVWGRVCFCHCSPLFIRDTPTCVGKSFF